MRIMHPYAGDNIADVCRRAYFELDKSDEPIIIHFNEVTVIFTKDEGGYHHKEHSIDSVELEWISGMNVGELYSLHRTKIEGDEK